MTFNTINTNKNFFDNQNFVLGFEPEFNTVTFNEMNRYNRSLGENRIKGLNYVFDGSQVDGEASLPILSNCEKSKLYLKSVLEQLVAKQATVNWTCSIHIHVSRRPIIIDPTEFHDMSVAHSERHNTPLPSNDRASYFGNAIPLEIAKDIVPAMRRVYNNRGQKNGYFCKKPSTTDAILNSTSLYQLQRSISPASKYSSINLYHWSDYETIEYRSHGGTFEIEKIWSYAMFLIAMQKHSIINRHNQVQQLINTPDYIGRSANTRQSLAYSVMRRQGGATVQEIMNASGIQTAQRVRSMISEQIRPNLLRQFNRDVLITHNQQYYNHAYNTSQGRYDLNGYEIPLQVNNGSGGAVFASNGGTDLLLGLDNNYKHNLKPFRNYNFEDLI